MTRLYFLVVALVGISQFVTANHFVIHLWISPLAEDYKIYNIPRHSNVTLQCSNPIVETRTCWTFTRPEQQILTTTLSNTLEIRKFNESHVGNYQCRAFPLDGTEIWRSFMLCMTNERNKYTRYDNSFWPTCSNTSESKNLQVIKFNLLRKPKEAGRQYPYSELTNLTSRNFSESRIKIENGTTFRLKCPFDEKKDLSLIWIVNRGLHYKRLVKYNNGSVTSLNVLGNGQYDCLVGSNVEYVGHKFIVRVIQTDADPVEETDQSLSTKIVIGSTGFILLLAVAVMVILCLRRRRNRRNLTAIALSLPVKSTDECNSVCGSRETITDAIILPVVRRKHTDLPDYVDSDWIYSRVSDYGTVQDDSWEIERDYLTLVEAMSEDDSGRIFKGHLANFVPGRLIEVTVKTQNENPAKTIVAALNGELEAMKAIGNHPNIVNLLGACTESVSFCIVMEYARHGNLRDYLRQQLPSTGCETIAEQKLLTEKELVSYAEQVAKGMEYLASRGCVHRSLAAVNVLVANKFILKIADYAIGTETRSSFTRRRSELSFFKWMAPETLSNEIYTVKANVWSYGILFWEIMTFADEPYPSISSGEQLLHELRTGYRMIKPIHCSTDAYTLMTECWSHNPADRPMFSDLVRCLGDILTRSTKEPSSTVIEETYENLTSSSHA